MTALTRRRSDNDHQETWHIYFSDVRIGTIGVRGGVPTTADEWGLGRRLLSRHGTEGTAIWFGRHVRRSPRRVRGRMAATRADADGGELRGVAACGPSSQRSPASASAW